MTFRLSRTLGVVVLVLLGAACTRRVDLDKAAVGQDVTVITSDGEVVEGTVTSRDEKNVRVRTGVTTKAIANDQIVDLTVIDKTRPVVVSPLARFREYTVPDGTKLSLTLTTAIDSRTSKVEDPVEASLVEAVLVGEAEVWPSGSTVKGTVSAVEASGKVKGLAAITLHFTSLAPLGRTDRYDIVATYSETADATKGEDAAKIGIGAGAGAAVGGLLDGKGGAAKGAAVGGGAGTAVVLATTGKEVEHPAGARLTVRLQKSVDVRVPIR